MGMLRYMEPFFTDHIPSVLLTGNGLHRAFENSNWDKLLKDLSKGRFTEKKWEIPNNDIISIINDCFRIKNNISKIDKIKSEIENLI